MVISELRYFLDILKIELKLFAIYHIILDFVLSNTDFFFQYITYLDLGFMYLEFIKLDCYKEPVNVARGT